MQSQLEARLLCLSGLLEWFYFSSVITGSGWLMAADNDKYERLTEMADYV